jgi:hypothetical protein
MTNVIALENANDSGRRPTTDDIKRQAQAGIQVINFDKQFYDKAYDVAGPTSSRRARPTGRR